MRSLRAFVTVIALLMQVAGATGAAPPDPPNEQEKSPPMPMERALDGLHSGDLDTRVAAAAALAQHAEAGDREAISTLLELLDAEPSQLRYHAEWGLARSGELSVPALAQAFERDHDDGRRARLALVLGRIGLAARPAAPLLVAALDDPHSKTASRAAAALASMRWRAALPELERVYATARKLPTQRAVARAIDTIGSDQSARRARERLAQTVRAELEGDDAPERSTAIAFSERVLHTMRTQAPAYLPRAEALATWVPGLERALDESSPDTLAAVRALGHVGVEAGTAVPRLQALLRDPEFEGEAARALAGIATPEANRILAERERIAGFEKRVRSEYSIFDHQGRVRLLPFDVFGKGEDSVRMDLRFLHTGEVPLRPEWVVVSFESYSAEPRFLDIESIEWRADGRTISLRGLDRAQSTSRKGVIERVSGLLTVEDFERIAGAGHVAARIGSVRFELDSDERDALSYFASRIPQADTPASPE